MKRISRREMLGTAGFVGTSLAAGLPMAAATAESQNADRKSTGSKLKVVVTGGHPGDPEYGCGGTIARYSDLGPEVVLLYLNKGEPPEKTPDAARGVRVAEA